MLLLIPESFQELDNFALSPKDSVHLSSERRLAIQRSTDCFASTENGQWTYKENSTLFHPEDVHDILGKCNETYYDRSANYQWTVRDGGCPSHWQPFNKTRFCELMRGRNIIFIGDSLSFNMGTSLAAMYRKPFRDTINAKATICGEKNGDSKEVTVRHARNSLLSWNTDENYRFYTKPVNLHGRRWLEARNMNKALFQDGVAYDIIVLNKGAHYHEDYWYKLELDRVLSHLTTSLPQASILFRSTSLGHGHCERHEQPLTRDPPQEEIASWPFHYGQFRHQNRLARALVTDKYQQFYLDIEKPTLLRPDAHPGAKDCLHYCAPGPVDYWNAALFNWLVLSEKR